MSETIGFIGLGAMGLGMSLNLCRAGFAVRGFDVDPKKVARFVDGGGSGADSAQGAATGADRLFICVFSADEAQSLLSESTGILEALETGATVIMHATMAPERSRALAKMVLAAGCDYVEAPVTGGQQGADDGTLTAIVAGDESLLDALGPAFDAFCEKVYRVGNQPGQALTVKMINQLLVGVHINATAEAMALAVRAGADPNVTFEVISNGRGNSTIFMARAPRLLAGHEELPRTVEIFLKDLGVVLEAGRDLQMPLPLTASVYQQFLGAAALAAQNKGEASVATWYENITGIDIAAAARDRATR